MGLNVILPCAGEGSRLGLPYPKEMHVVAEGTSLIELSLGLLAPWRERIERVTVVLTPQKAALLETLHGWRRELPLAFCFYDDRLHEWPGSILSARHLFLDKNAVLLPDSCIVQDAEHPVVPSMERLLEGSELVFGYRRASSDALRSLGALAVDLEHGRVDGFCDKPDEGLERFNAFWTTFGFRGAAGPAVLAMMMESVQRRPVDLRALGLDVSAFPVADYVDLGTWESLSRFRREAAERATASAA